MTETSTNTEWLGKAIKAFTDYYAEHGKYPSSIKDFCQKNQLDSDEFYQHFHSFAHLEKKFWEHAFAATQKSLTEQQEYESYSVRNKLHAFFYSWIEVLGTFRAYVKKAHPNAGNLLGFSPNRLSFLKKDFLAFASDLLDEGKLTKEFAGRKLLEKSYPSLFWLEFNFVTRYWIKDSTENQELTDAAIEKSVNVLMDFLSPNTMDSLLDFGKFLFTSPKK